MHLFSSRCVQIKDLLALTLSLHMQVELSLWDTAGQERFHSLGPIYYRDAAAALLVFDITDKDSFERVKAWVRELRQMVHNSFCLTPHHSMESVIEQP